MLLQDAHDLGHLRALLADRYVDTGQLLALLVDDRVDRQRRLAGLAVADNQLALAAPDRDHRVDRDDPGLHRGIDRLARDHARRDPLDLAQFAGVDRAFVIDRLPQRVDHAPEQLLADRHRDHPPGRADLVALLDAEIIAQDDRADRIALEV